MNGTIDLLGFGDGFHDGFVLSMIHQTNPPLNDN
jgi:hypothetical protein